ncbi:MAG: DUF2142 domain-containing protein [Chloroflexota bacterium]
MRRLSLSNSLRISLVLLIAILFGYLVIAILFAVKTPAWQVPDEPAHYNYVRQVAANGCCPVLQSGDWDNDYLNRIKAAKFSPQSIGDRLNTIRYEDHQPPLYYLLAAPVYAASSGNLITLRLLSVLLGAGVVILAWAVVQTVFPAQAWLALATAAFVAFLPQHVAMMAGVENDSLTELIVGIILLACAVYVGNSQRKVHPLLLGLLLGVAFWTKLTVMLPMLPVVGIAILLRARRDQWSLLRLGREIAWVGVPAILIGLPFWIRNLNTYGGLDFLAQAAHDRIVVGQIRTDEYIAAHSLSGWISDALVTTFHSFWGQFGWMSTPLPTTFYTALLVFSLFVIVGAVLAFRRWRQSLTPPQWDMLILFGVTILAAIVMIVGYNLKFVQFQGRYIYPALIPIAFFVSVGLTGWTTLFTGRTATITRWAIVGAVCLFAILDVYVLFRIIIPSLA